jgi:hypothetical protein
LHLNVEPEQTTFVRLILLQSPHLMNYGIRRRVLPAIEAGLGHFAKQIILIITVILGEFSNFVCMSMLRILLFASGSLETLVCQKFHGRSVQIQAKDGLLSIGSHGFVLTCDAG